MTAFGNHLELKAAAEGETPKVATAGARSRENAHEPSKLKNDSFGT